MMMNNGEYGDGVYRSSEQTHGGYGMPRGPVPTIPDAAPTTAIGFCPMCAENARQTCSNRGSFDCPNCTFWWFDDRVGVQSRSFDDYFVPAADGGNDQPQDTDTE